MKQEQFFRIPLLLSLLATTCLSFKDDGMTPSLRAGSRSQRKTEESCRSVRDIICGAPDTNTFCDLITKASDTYTEFGEGLDGDRPYTVFAPTDEAFDRYEAELLGLKEAELYRTLLFHFYEDIALRDDDLSCQGKLVSLTGDMSRTKCKRIEAGVYTKQQRGRGNKAIGDFPVIDVDTSSEACAGVVHKLSHVLLPIAFKPFQPYVLEADEVVDVSEDESEDEDEAKEIVDVVEEEKAVVEKEEEAASALCFFNCPPSPAPVSAPAPASSSLCFFNCPSEAPAPTTAPALCFFNCPPEEETTAAEETVAPEPAEEAEEEDPPMISPPLKKNGIFLIFCATLLLCFMFLCLRK